MKAKIARGLPPEEWALSADERERAAQDAVKSLRDKYVNVWVMWRWRF